MAHADPDAADPDADVAAVTGLELSADTPVIDNPISGERIVIRQCADETGGALLAWELLLARGGRVPSPHAHPEQEERFTLLGGVMRFRVRGRAVTLTAGETLTIPAGTVHSFANAGRGPAHVAVETRPALEMQALLETAAAMAREQHAAGRPLPRPADLVLFMRDFEREVRAPFLPAPLVRPVVRCLARLASACRRDERYRRIRGAG
jgi:quercetin dioxygenase-like cupin family protein